SSSSRNWSSSGEREVRLGGRAGTAWRSSCLGKEPSNPVANGKYIPVPKRCHSTLLRVSCLPRVAFIRMGEFMLTDLRTGSVHRNERYTSMQGELRLSQSGRDIVLLRLASE